MFYDGLRINDILVLRFAPELADELCTVEEGKSGEEIAQLSELWEWKYRNVWSVTVWSLPVVVRQHLRRPKRLCPQKNRATKLLYFSLDGFSPIKIPVEEQSEVSETEETKIPQKDNRRGTIAASLSTGIAIRHSDEINCSPFVNGEAATKWYRPPEKSKRD